MGITENGANLYFFILTLFNGFCVDQSVKLLQQFKLCTNPDPLEYLCDWQFGHEVRVGAEQGVKVRCGYW